jgi:hypothetical protein
LKTIGTGQNGHDYLTARARIENQILQLAKVRGISVSVQVEDSDPEVHRIQLICGRSRRVVEVDHETFVDEEFFRTLVLHQVQAAIDALAGQTKD